jgi:outer membrane cobalamin receptor
MSRPGEVLETVPGVIITQHSGEGKANQYFLRGFNLDHGTDFATTLAGMPVNLPTHAHGQGYSDLNSMIPELVSGVQFSKGPYYADQGDFATAGAANINYANARTCRFRARDSRTLNRRLDRIFRKRPAPSSQPERRSRVYITRSAACGGATSGHDR